MGLKEYMEEERPLTRWKVAAAVIFGTFVGAVITFVWMMAALA